MARTAGSTAFAAGISGYVVFGPFPAGTFIRGVFLHLSSDDPFDGVAAPLLQFNLMSDFDATRPVNVEFGESIGYGDPGIGIPAIFGLVFEDFFVPLSLRLDRLSWLVVSVEGSGFMFGIGGATCCVRCGIALPAKHAPREASYVG